LLVNNRGSRGITFYHISSPSQGNASQPNQAKNIQ